MMSSFTGTGSRRDTNSDTTGLKPGHVTTRVSASPDEGTGITQAVLLSLLQTLQRNSWEMCHLWDTGPLLQERNRTTVQFGHARLINTRGDYLAIGGSTAGASRRVLDGWKPPDWRQFLEDPGAAVIC